QLGDPVTHAGGRRAARFARGHRCDACQLQHSRGGIAADHRHRPIPRYGPFGNQRDWQHPGHGRDREVGGRAGGSRGTGSRAHAQGGLMRVMRARCVRRETADARSVRGWPRIVFAAASILILAAPANAQEAANVGALSGTLKKVKDTGTITLGYRESSLPFSYLNRRQQPIGYSIDLCREIVEDVSTELDGMEIKITFTPVTPANRLLKVASGEIDLECGSTTGNVQRRKEVAFSPIFFVAGSQLIVPRSSSVRSYRDLAGKTAVVTAGTTNEAALRALSDKQKLGITIITAPDHAQSLETLASGKAAAFATDDVLLYGFIAT